MYKEGEISSKKEINYNKIEAQSLTMSCQKEVFLC